MEKFTSKLLNSFKKRFASLRRIFPRLLNSFRKRFAKVERCLLLKIPKFSPHGGLNPSSKKTFFAVSMVKNEADIIELFLRINLRFFGRIYVLDHLSDDATPQIIQKLQAEGLPIEYILLANENGAYNQSEITTFYINKIAREVDCDYIVPLDADEFLHCWGFKKPEELFARATNSCGYCLIPWVTYCPINDLYLKGDAPLYSNFRARNQEPQQYYKVVMKRAFATTAKLEMGNHNVISELDLKPQRLFHVILQHVPVRSPEQITSKAVVGSMAYQLKHDRKPGDGYHWDELAEIALRSNFKLSHQCIQEIVLNYATPKGFNGRLHIPQSSSYPPVGKKTDNLRYKYLADINAKHNIEAFKKKFGGRLKTVE